MTRLHGFTTSSCSVPAIKPLLQDLEKLGQWCQSQLIPLALQAGNKSQRQLVELLSDVAAGMPAAAAALQQLLDQAALASSSQVQVVCCLADITHLPVHVQ